MINAEREQKVTYYLWNYDRRVVVQYRRMGSCCQCGECCRGSLRVSVRKSIEDGKPRQGGEVTSGKNQWVEARHNGRRIFFRMLGVEGQSSDCYWQNKQGLCTFYENRHFLCQAWPFTPHDIELFPECSYTFIELGRWTFEEVIAKIP